MVITIGNYFGLHLRLISIMHGFLVDDHRYAHIPSQWRKGQCSCARQNYTCTLILKLSLRMECWL